MDRTMLFGPGLYHVVGVSLVLMRERGCFGSIHPTTTTQRHGIGIMAMDGGEQRNCGVNELICVRRVSPEALGFLAAVGVIVVAMIVLFVYLNNKLAQDRSASPRCLDVLRNAKETPGGVSAIEKPCSKAELLPPVGGGGGSSSDSEEEMVGQYQEAGAGGRCSSRAHHQGQQRSWDTRPMYSPLSAVYDGYSSEASAQDASYIQRMRRTPPLDELQPPPYRDEDSSPRMSCCTPSDLGGAKEGGGDSPLLLLYAYGGGGGGGDNKCPSDSSGGGGVGGGGMQQDMERYLHKAYEEDPPSDSTAVLSAEGISANGWEALFPKGYEPDPDAKCGTLDVLFDYESKDQRLAVTITAVTDIPALKRTGNFSWQVHMILLPGRKQRARTGIQKGPCPMFTETFRFSHVEQQSIGEYAIRFRLYSVRRMKKEQVLGEKVFYLSKLHLQGRMSVPVILDPCCALQVGNSQGTVSDVSCSEESAASSFQSAFQSSSGPELLLGLLYSATTGRLSVEVVKGSHFRHLATNKPPHGLFCCLKHLIGGQVYIIRDTYVKLTLLNAVGQEMSKCKTSTCRGQPNPTYKETFVFQVALFQLSDVTLILSVFNKRSLQRKELLGWISLGLNSSGEEELAHWTHMKECKGQQVCRWHSLLES